MKRREFIRALGGVAALPFAALAEQIERMRRIGVLMALGVNDPEAAARITAFQMGLRQAGWEERRNVLIDIRWSAGNEKDIRQYAAELVALAPDVILANGNAAVAPLLL